MDSIVKIVLALKLKFLLIILSIVTSYLIEQHARKKAEPVQAIEAAGPVSGLRGSWDTEDSTASRVGSGDHFAVQPVDYVTNRPFTTQGLEIYIVL